MTIEADDPLLAMTRGDLVSIRTPRLIAFNTRTAFANAGIVA